MLVSGAFLPDIEVERDRVEEAVFKCVCSVIALLEPVL
jgi:hypothetical protein